MMLLLSFCEGILILWIFLICNWAYEPNFVNFKGSVHWKMLHLRSHDMYVKILLF